MSKKEEYQPIGQKTDKNGKTFIKCKNEKGNHKWYDWEKDEYVVGNPFKYDNIGIPNFDSKKEVFEWIKKIFTTNDQDKLWYINKDRAEELFEKYRTKYKENYEYTTFVLVRISEPGTKKVNRKEHVATMDILENRKH